MRYRYYEADWQKLPAFDAFEPEAEGVVPSISLDPGKRVEYFGLLFDGFIEVPTDGIYKFFLVSDDGSRLWIGDTLVVDNDGLHGAELAEGRIALAAGKHAIRVGYFQRTGGAEIEAGYSGPGLEKQSISEEVLSYN